MSILAGLFLSLFGIAEILYHFFKVKAELTRKLVHIGTGLLTFLFPVMLGNHWFVLILCFVFTILLIISIRVKWFPSIHAIDRDSVGSLAYPVAVYGCYLAYDYFHQNYIYFYLPILILAICDPLAALFGKRWPYGKYKIGMDNKTLMGSTAFFLSAVILTLVFFFFPRVEKSTLELIFHSIFIAFVAALIEAFSKRGYDNLSIPASVLFCIIITERYFSFL
jgi:dolichol kinase